MHYSPGDTVNGTTVNPAITSEAMEEDTRLPRVMFLETRIAYFVDHILKEIVTPLLGLTGNMLAIILLRRPKFRNLPSSFFMILLAVLDSGTLIVGNFVFSNIDFWAWYCKIIIFLLRLFAESSSWVLALMSAERCIAISMPLRSRKFLSNKTNRISAAIVIAIVACGHSYGLMLLKEKNSHCFLTKIPIFKYLHIVMDYFVLLVIPAVIIVIANCIICICLLRARAKNISLTEGHGSSAADARMKSMVTMLISISTAFVILKTPYHILYFFLERRVYGYYVYTRRDARVSLAFAITVLMQFTNHCINFYLYILSGSEFKAELVSMIRAGKTRIVSAISTASTTLPSEQSSSQHKV